VFTYIKLDDNRGWVTMYHPITGGTLLETVSRAAVPNSNASSGASSRASPVVAGVKAPKVPKPAASATKAAPDSGPGASGSVMRPPPPPIPPNAASRLKNSEENKRVSL